MCTAPAARCEDGPGRGREVIPARTVPKSGASGVQIGTYLQVVFTEPVRKISGNVFLKDAKGQGVGVKLSGARFTGEVVENLDASPDAVITSLTVQPLTGLDYGATYTLELTDGIEDLDATPLGLVPYMTSFTTFTPESLSQNPESFGSPGIVILGERAYLVRNDFYSGTLRVFETSDPVSPLEIPNSESDSRDPRYTVSYRPVDLVGESDSPLTGGRVVAVVTGSTAQSKPSNVWLLDVNDDAQTQWIGAVSLTSSAGDGFVSRTFLRAGVLYSATFRKGIQVVDLGKVKDAFKAPGTAGYFQMSQAFLTDGQGFGQENVVNINVTSPFGGPARLNDIEAALVQTTDGAQVLVAAPGDPGLTVVNPAFPSPLWNDKVTYERDDGGQKVVEATLGYGQAIAMGNVAGQDLAVIVGTGTILQDAQSRPLLMVVSLYDPQNPVGLGYVLLDDATVGDVILKDDLALLGGSKQVTLVSLTDPAHPKVLGTAQGVGGRLALSENGSILFSTERSVFGGTNLPLGGVRTAALGNLTFITDVKEDPVILDVNRKSVEPRTIKYRALYPREQIETAELEIVKTTGSQESVTQRYAVSVGEDGTGSHTVPAGIDHPSGAVMKVRLVVNRQKSPADQPPAAARAIKGDLLDVQPEGDDGTGVLNVLASEDPYQVVGLSAAILDRLQKASGSYQPPSITWSLDGSAGGQQASGALGATLGGLYEGVYAPGGMAGALQRVQISIGPSVVGRTGVFQVRPGVAASGTALAGADPPDGSSASPGIIPADGKTTIGVWVRNVRDAFGNLVDGSTVSWSVVGDGGRILNAQTPLSLGASATQYQAGDEPGTVSIVAKIDSGDAAPAVITIMHVPLKVLIGAQGDQLVVQVTSDAGPPADGTIVEWGTTAGSVVLDDASQLELKGGTSFARWESPADTTKLQRVIGIFATVARARGDIGYDRVSEQNLPGPSVLVTDRIVVGDNNQGGGGFQAYTTAKVEGDPGSSVRLVLGSVRHPAHMPVATYPMDAIDYPHGEQAPGVSADAYGQYPGAVGQGVSLDLTTVAMQGAGSFHFSGTGSVSIPDAPAFDLVGDFGIGAYVRFESVAAPQTVISKGQAWSLDLTQDTGPPLLRFSVWSAGQRKAALSAVAIEPDVWYHVSAQVRSGKLAISVGTGELVDEGETAGAVDRSSAPIVLGTTLQGNLDNVSFYDYSQTPLATFPDGSIETTLTLDAQGAAEVAILSTGVFHEANINAEDAFSVPLVIRFDAPDSRQQSPAETFFLETFSRTHTCATGIATGEGKDGTATACELFGALIPAVGTYELFRDLFKTGRKFVKGKQTRGDYITGGVVLLGVALTAIPVIGKVVKGVKAAREAAAVESVQKEILKQELNAAEAAAAAARGEAEEAAAKELKGALGAEATEEAAQAASEIAARLTNPVTVGRIQRLAVFFDADAFALRLSALLKDGRFSSTLLESVLEEIEGVTAALKPGVRLSADTLEGAAALAARTNPKRISTLWQAIGVSPKADQAAVFENFLGWVKQGDTLGIDGWKRLLAIGLSPTARVGQSVGYSGMALNASRGCYNTLEFLVKDLGFQGIKSLEFKEGARVIDILMTDGTRFELKNIGKLAEDGVTLIVKLDGKAQVLKDVRTIVQNAGGNLDLIRQGLAKLRYVFRGTEAQMAPAVAELRAALAEGLKDHPTFVEVVTNGVKYLNRGLPF